MVGGRIGETSGAAGADNLGGATGLMEGGGMTFSRGRRSWTLRFAGWVISSDRVGGGSGVTAACGTTGLEPNGSVRYSRGCAEGEGEAPALAGAVATFGPAGGATLARNWAPPPDGATSVTS